MANGPPYTLIDSSHTSILIELATRGFSLVSASAPVHCALLNVFELCLPPRALDVWEREANNYNCPSKLVCKVYALGDFPAND